MKIAFNTLTIIITTFLFFSCNQDDPNLFDYSKIEGTVNNGTYYNNQIDSVYGVIYYDYIVNKSEVIAKSKFQNGGFYLNLPILTEDKLYCTIDTLFPKSIVISDKSTKINFLYLRCMSMGYKIGDLFLHNAVDRLDSGYIECDYIYCNKSVSVKGTTREVNNLYTITTNYDLTFKKGWNLMTRSASILNFDRKTYLTSNDLPTGVIWYPSILFIIEPVRQKKL